MKAPILTQQIVQRLLHYDASTGIFLWRPRTDVRKGWNTRYAGKPAGYTWRPKGSSVTYLCIRVFDYPFCGHRLAVLYMTGAWPTCEVDHRDLDGLNNRWSNLRLATKAQNTANRRPPVNNRSGFKGVSIDGDRFRATFRRKFLGYRATAEEAAELYNEAAHRHFGEFARIS